MEHNDGAGDVLTADAVMAKGRRRLTLPSGGAVVVGRLEIDDLTEALGGMPDVSALAAARDQGPAGVARRPEAKTLLAKMALVIRKGTIDPELHEKRKDGPTPLDFTIEDRALMFRTILELSSYTEKAGAEVLPLSGTAG